MDVLLFLGSQTRPAPAAAVARACGLPRSSAYHLLNVMKERQFVAYFPRDRAWGLGIKAFELGSAYLRTEPLEWLSRSVLEELAESSGHTAHVAILHGDEVMYLAKREPRNGALVLVTDVGVRLPAHLTAVGRAILARLPPSQLRAVYPTGRPLIRRTKIGPQFRFDLEKLLSRDRAQGYVLERDSTTEGITCIAAPVLSYSGLPTAAVNVCLPSGICDSDTQSGLIGLVSQAAEKLSRSLGWNGEELPATAD